MRQTRQILSILAITLCAMTGLAQQLEIERSVHLKDTADPVAEKGRTISQKGVAVSFEAVIANDRLEDYRYHGIENLEPGDQIQIYSYKFRPADERIRTTSAGPHGDWATISVAAVHPHGNAIRIDLAEPIRVWNSSMVGRESRGNAPPAKPKYVERIMFIGGSDGSWRLVSAPKAPHAVRETGEPE